MSELNEASATPSAAEATTADTAADHSAETATTSDIPSTEEFQKSIDEDWGIPVEDDDVATYDADEPEEEAPVEPDEEIEEETIAEEPAGEAEEAQQPAAGPTLHVNFLGQGYDLPEDAARRFAQIGMNAGRLQEKYDQLKPLEPLRDAIEVMAQFRGQPIEEIIGEIGNMGSLRQSEIAALVADGHDEALAEELVDGKLKEARQKRDLERMQRPQQQGLTELQKDQIRQFAMFRPDAHADIMAGKPMPPEVLEEWRNGADLTTAWLLSENRAYQDEAATMSKRIKELEKELKEAKSSAKKLAKNAENKSKAPTRKKGTGGGTGSGTDIFAGWDKI